MGIRLARAGREFDLPSDLLKTFKGDAMYFQHHSKLKALLALPLLALGAAHAVGPDLGSIAHQIPGRDLSVHPPMVHSMHVFPVDGIGSATSRLEVRFKESLPRVISFIHEGSVVSLRDDGTSGDRASDDGVYSALIKVDNKALLDQAVAMPPPKDIASQVAQSDGGIPVAVQSVAAPQTVSGTSVAATAVDPKYLVDPEKALLIRNLSVMNHYYRTNDPCKNEPNPPAGQGDPAPADSDKHWTFGHLFTEMTNQKSTGMTTSDFALKWLDEWAKTQVINGDSLKEVDGGAQGATIAKTIKAQWLKASGGNGKLKMGKAPFRLLAIVNRIDKRDNLAFGGGSAGELRFVFGVLDLEHHETSTGKCASMDMTGRHLHDGEFSSGTTVILEYAVDKSTQADVKTWGQKWIDLNKLTQNSSAYRVALDAITESVVKAGAGAVKSRANGSALNTLRVNESDDDNIWDLREFAIDKSAKYLKATTVSQTPATILNHTADLEAWANYHAEEIMDDKHVIPKTFQADPSSSTYPYTHKSFLGSHAQTVFLDNNWDFGGSGEVRFHFSVNTCNGCHNNEGLQVNGGPFHVQGRAWNQVADISPYLSGITICCTGAPFVATDPRTGELRPFHELENRRQGLAALMSGTSLSALSFQPTTQVH
jgi:hypothetical protein